MSNKEKGRNTVKAISLWQPWASAMALGFKKIETRSWSTNYRGFLLIHAAKKVIQWPDIRTQAMFDGIVSQPSDLPLGQILCVVNLIGCELIRVLNCPLTYSEQVWGDYTSGRYKWITKDLQEISPFPYRGRQGLFDVPDILVHTQL